MVLRREMFHAPTIIIFRFWVAGRLERRRDWSASVLACSGDKHDCGPQPGTVALQPSTGGFFSAEIVSKEQTQRPFLHFGPDVFDVGLHRAAGCLYWH